MWHAHAGFFPFGCIIFVLLIGFLLFRLIWWRGCGYNRRWQDGRSEAEAILKRRLANGEISEAEYQQLREALKK